MPKVETRKRREDRWERNLLELGELLSTQVSKLAQEAYHAQSLWRVFRRGGAIESQPDVNQARLEEVRREWGLKAQQADDDFYDLVNTRVDWLADRIGSIARGSAIIGEFESAARSYWVSALFNHFPTQEVDDRTDRDFQDAWNSERVARRALIRQVGRLANLPHPPRTSWHRRGQDWRGLLGGPDPGEPRQAP